MKKKTCNKCKEEKELIHFHKDNARNDGHNIYCKNCRSTKKPEQEYNGFKTCSNCKEEKEISEFNKQKIGKFGHRADCRLCQNKFNNANVNKEAQREYYKNNETKIKEYQSQWREENKQHKSDQNKEYRKLNKIKISKKRYQKRKNSIQLRIIHNVSTRILQVLKGKSKSKNTLALLGCSGKEFKIYIESLFVNGMNWDNHGRGWQGKKEWHLDHRMPCASFDLSDPKHQEECFHYSNLQPLWAEDNLKKGSKVNYAS